MAPGTFTVQSITGEKAHAPHNPPVMSDENQLRLSNFEPNAHIQRQHSDGFKKRPVFLNFLMMARYSSVTMLFTGRCGTWGGNIFIASHIRDEFVIYLVQI